MSARSQYENILMLQTALNNIYSAKSELKWNKKIKCIYTLFTYL